MIEELVSENVDTGDDSSELVAGFAEKTRLIAFLKNNPAISADTNLGPYLFLAQTSISRGEQMRLLPPDEKAQTLAKSIAGTDRVMSKAAALRAAAEEHGTAESVIRHLINMVTSAADNRVRTHILTGIDMICAKHRQFYTEAMKGLERFEPGKNTAIGIAGNTLLANAEKTGITVPQELRKKFENAAGKLSVLSGSKRRSGK